MYWESHTRLLLWTHQTLTIIACLRQLNGNGHVLYICGMDKRTITFSAPGTIKRLDYRHISDYLLSQRTNKQLRNGSRLISHK